MEYAAALKSADENHEGSSPSLRTKFKIMNHPIVQIFEAHVTIEPVFDERFEEFQTHCSKYNFRPAELLMQKMRLATAIRSSKDTFATGHDKSFDNILDRTQSLVFELKDAGFDVWRYKIEGIVTDVRYDRLYQVSPKKA